MHEGDSLSVVEVRVSVDISLVAVGRPSGMADCDLVIVSLKAFNCHPLDAISAEPVAASKFSRYKS